jgi:hypothetical protein
MAVRGIPLIEFLEMPDMESELAKHGGRRAGAGRKPLAEGRLTRCYALTSRHVDALERYRQQHNLTSASEAIRHLIEAYVDA